jgi:hypothetical protein
VVIRLMVIEELRRPELRRQPREALVDVPSFPDDS